MNKPPFKETSMKRSPIPRLPEMAAACRAAAAAAMALGCASCNFAPKYERPPAAVPAAFKEAPAAADSDAAALRPSKPNDGAIRPKWWELYNDPVLNSLEEQVSVSNQTLLSSEANYRVSRALLVEARAALFPAVTTSPSVTRARSSATYSSSSGNASTAAVGGGGAPPGSIVNEIHPGSLGPRPKLGGRGQVLRAGLRGGAGHGDAQHPGAARRRLLPASRG
jgi:hypothetical protein